MRRRNNDWADLIGELKLIEPRISVVNSLDVDAMKDVYFQVGAARMELRAVALRSSQMKKHHQHLKHAVIKVGWPSSQYTPFEAALMATCINDVLRVTMHASRLFQRHIFDSRDGFMVKQVNGMP